VKGRGGCLHGVLAGTSPNMTSFRKISSRVLAQGRAEEARLRAALDAALAKALPPHVSKENWTNWNRYGWFGCPGNRRRTCSDSACAIGASCKRMAELGLAGDGTPLWRKDRPRCGARTRKGTPCLVRVQPGKGAAASTVGSQPARGPPRARRGSQQRSAGGGPSDEAQFRPGSTDVMVGWRRHG
jgi:hypothetical protein